MPSFRLHNVAIMGSDSSQYSSSDCPPITRQTRHAEPFKHAYRSTVSGSSSRTGTLRRDPSWEFAAPALHLLAGLLNDSTELETQLQVCHPHFLVHQQSRHEGQSPGSLHAPGCPCM